MSVRTTTSCVSSGSGKLDSNVCRYFEICLDEHALCILIETLFPFNIELVLRLVRNTNVLKSIL